MKYMCEKTEGAGGVAQLTKGLTVRLSEFDSCNPQGGREKPIPGSCPVTSTSSLQYMYAHKHAHVH